MTPTPPQYPVFFRSLSLIFSFLFSAFVYKSTRFLPLFSLSAGPTFTSNHQNAAVRRFLERNLPFNSHTQLVLESGVLSGPLKSHENQATRRCRFGELLPP